MTGGATSGEYTERGAAETPRAATRETSAAAKCISVITRGECLAIVNVQI